MTKQHAAAIVDIKPTKQLTNTEVIKNKKVYIKNAEESINVLSILQSNSVTFFEDVSKIQDIKSRSRLENLGMHIVPYLAKTIMFNQEGRESYTTKYLPEKYTKEEAENNLSLWRVVAQINKLSHLRRQPSS
jgi:hypothetical protein